MYIYISTPTHLIEDIVLYINGNTCVYALTYACTDLIPTP